MAELHRAQRSPLQALRPDQGPSNGRFDAFARASLLAAVVAALAALVAPFDHAAWLVAYLVLVGFAAQALLGRGQTALSRSPGAPIGTQLIFWNAGVVLVPAGVFVNARLLVVLGGLALLVALVSFWRRTDPLRQARLGPAALPVAYALLTILMSISAFIGIALAWHRPWI